MSTSKQRDRKCASCRHYQPSPLWRKGWCRNPLLFDPSTNHLVEADSLSCQRAFIDYWEARSPKDVPVMGPTAPTADTPLTRPRVAPSIPLTPTGPGGQPLRAPRAATAEAISLPREKPPLTLVRPPGPPVEPAADVAADDAFEPPEGGDVTQPLPVVGQDSAANSAPTAAIRIQGVTPAPPKPTPAPGVSRTRQILAAGVVLGVLVLLAVWVPRVNPKLGINIPGFGPKATAVPTVTRTAVALFVPPTATAEPPPPPPTETPAPPPPAPVLQLAVGGTAQVGNTGGSGLRIRQTPSTTGRILVKVPDGARLQLKGGPQTTGSITWWQVTGFDTKGTVGWCVDTYLKPVP
jgi:hypothetical protein